ncbi:putative major pilin subunit [Planctomycetes bacterium Poly30]|uniref:Putative major pilin subunit n=1 Tax=Saltatorellus ferox TaxID=2528018 RepID=A0A518EUA9_9BACT|nr:putative major pilin subunit [Planctomycetes bacterium Poly30]
MHRNDRAGFTLIELTIVVTIIAMIAAVAIPTYVAARSSSNESAAIATLRHIATAQAQLVACSAIDSNANGGGEVGYFGELTGATPIRVFSAMGPALGGPLQRLDPDLLGVRFERIVSDGTDGVAMAGGYYFKMFLPDASPLPPVNGIGEDPLGGARSGTLPGATNSERLWACYAWPVSHGRTGHRAFFINQDGEVLATQNFPAQAGGSYSGVARVPAADAVFSQPSDISSRPATARSGLAAQDQLLWSRVGG